MKNIFVLSFIILIIQGINAQDYVPMLADSNTWYVFSGASSGHSDLYIAKDDTVINNKKYKVLGVDYFLSSSLQVLGYIREDTIEKRVYMIPYSYNEPDTVEIIYFDFSLNENDSILLYELNHDSIGYFRVDSIWNISTLAGDRRALYLKSPDWDYWEGPIWVEGVGTLGNIAYREQPPHFYNFGELSCFFMDDIKVFQSQFSEEKDTCIIFSTSVEDFKSRPEINIYPNPANSEINIEFKNNLPFSVSIFDLYGRLILEASNQKNIKLNNFSNGTYIIKVKQRNGIMTVRFIVIR